MKEPTELIGCYISKSFSELIREFCRENGYNTKSEFLRSAIRDKLSVGKKA